MATYCDWQMPFENNDMTADLVSFALLPFVVGIIVAAELWRPIMEDEPATRWADNTDRFPDDERLREAGWQIKTRPRKGPDTWILLSINGEVIVEMTTEQALTTLGKRDEFRKIGRRERG